MMKRDQIKPLPLQAEDAAQPLTDRDYGREWVLNGRLLAITGIVLAVLLPAVYAWHAYQVRRQATAFLERADALEKDEPARAVTYMFRYLQFHPQENAVWIRLAKTFDRSAQTAREKKRATEWYSLALGKGPDRKDETAIRQRQAELYLELGRFPDAATQAVQLLATDPQDPVALRVLATTVYARIRTAGMLTLTDIDALYKAAVPPGKKGLSPAEMVAGIFQRAIERNPNDIRLPVLFAAFYRVDMESPAAADAVIDRMVQANPKKAEAFLARSYYRAQYNAAAAGGGNQDNDLTTALGLAPRNLDVLLAVGARAEQGVRAIADKAQQQPLLAEARKRYQQAIEVAPKDSRAYLRLAMVESTDGNAARAVETCRKGLARVGAQDLALNLQLAELLISQGQLDEARKPLDLLDQAMASLGPSVAESGPEQRRERLQAGIDFLRARWLVAKGDYLRATPLLSRVAVAQKGWSQSSREVYQQVQTLLYLGQCHAVQKHWDLAAAAYEQAAALQPDSPMPRLAAAEAWTSAGRPDVAVPQYQKALAMKDAPPAAWVSLARAQLQDQLSLPKADRKFDKFQATLIKAREGAPSSLPLQLLEAEFAASEDRTDEAIRFLEAAEAASPKAEEPVRALVLAHEQWGQPADADKALARFEKLSGNTAQSVILRAELLSRRKQDDQAQKLIRSKLESLPADQRPSLAFYLAQLSLRTGRVQQARTELAQLAKAYPSQMQLAEQLAELALDAGDAADLEKWETQLRQIEGEGGTQWRYYRARRLLALAKNVKDDAFAEATRLQAAIETARPSWPPTHVLKGQLAERQGQTGQAIEAYEKAVYFGEKRLSTFERLVALLYREGRFDDAERQLTRLQETVSRSRDLSSLAIAVSARQNDLNEALRVAREGATRRPNDPMAQVWLGQALLLDTGRAEAKQEAEAAFRRATQIAPKEVRTWAALLTFYVRTQQPQGVREVVKTLETLDTNVSSSMAQLPFLLAQGYELVGEPTKAEAQLKRATEKSPQDSRTWAALLSHYVRARQMDGARGALEGLSRNAKLPEAEKSFVLAQGYASIGDRPTAEKLYRAALLAAPEDVNLLRQAASFFIASDPAKAEEYLRHALRISPDRSLARRELATFLASRRGETQWQEAIQLLKTPPAEAAATVLDQRLRALLLLQRGGDDNRRQARQLLEQLVKDDGKAIAGDRLLLAQVYEAEKTNESIALAKAQLLKLVGAEKPDPAHQAAYVDLVLRHNGGEEATATLDRLEKSEPDAFRTLELRVRWLKSQNRAAEIGPQVEKFVEKTLKTLNNDAQKGQFLVTVAGLYSSVDQFPAAEGKYRQAAALVPRLYLPWAGWLADRGRAAEAIALCAKAAETDVTAESAVNLASVLTRGKPSAKDLEAAEPVLARAIQKFPRDASLLVAVATLRFVQQKTAEATRLYRQALDVDPKHLTAMNNLATLLAEQPQQGQEALAYVKKAIDLAGRQGWLLDTQGMVLFQTGQMSEAVKVLKEAVASPSADPRYQFHLALAYQRTGAADEARKSLQEARDKDLASQLLTTSERALLTDLEKRLGL
ncbi:MAG: tetratricopeptide repeat protein [Pirellulales bacterium]